VIPIEGAVPDREPPRFGVYPLPGAARAYKDVVVKAFFSEPVTGVGGSSFTLTDASGQTVPASVDPIGDGAWGLFPSQILLTPGATYTAHLAPGICDAAANCTERARPGASRSRRPRRRRGRHQHPEGFLGAPASRPDIGPT